MPRKSTRLTPLATPTVSRDAVQHAREEAEDRHDDADAEPERAYFSRNWRRRTSSKMSTSTTTAVMAVRTVSFT